jgi:hypothetical protein
MRAKFVKENLFINEIGIILTSATLWYILDFIKKEFFTTPQQKLEKFERKCLKDIYFIIKSRIDEPEKAPIYSDEYFFHKITFPFKNKYFHDYIIKINKNTKYLYVETDTKYRPIKLNDDQYDKFMDIIKKIKKTI